MRPVSERFLRALRGSHKYAVRARVCPTWQTGTDPDGEELPEIIDGDVTADATSDIRATLAMTVNGPWSSKWDGLLTPYGNEVFVERGMEFGNGVREWVSLGYFKMTNAEQDEAPKGPIRIAASDRILPMVEAELTAPRPFTKNHTVRQVVDSLIPGVYQGEVFVEYDFDPDAVALGRAVVVDRDRFGFLRDLAASHGKILYFDYKGDLQFRHPPNPTAPVWEINSGANGVLVKLSQYLSREGIFNAVVAEGEGADAENPVRGIAFDADPYSPTYWRGRFGKKPRFYSSPLITNKEQATAAAETELLKTLGRPFHMDLTAVPNSALEVYDPVRVKTSAGYNIHVLERATIPLTAAGPMTGTTRDFASLKIETEGL